VAQALFDINADGGNQGFAATNSQVLTLRLRQQPPLGVATVLFQVFNPAGFDPTLRIAANPPRASLAAPALTVVGATSGPSASPATVDGSVTITMPATGSHSWIVRCVVNGGLRTLPGGQQVVDPTLIHERGVYVPTVLGARKVVCTELRQFSDDGWAGALGNIPDLIVADHTITYPKLPLAAAAPSVIGATVNGNVIELPLSTFRGVGMTVVGATLAPRLRPRAVQLQEYFISGNLVSGSIGSLGWNLLGTGTPSYARGVPSIMGSSGRGELTTSAAVNDRAVLVLGETESRDILPPTDLNFLQCVVNQDAVLTNKRFFFGLQDTMASEPSAATANLGIYYDSAVSPNYQIIARTGAAGTPTNTGVAVPSTTAELLTILRVADDNYQFYSGNTLLGTITSGVSDATAMAVGFRVETLSTASKHVNIGYFGLDARATSAYDDDTFLEA
jgi:hypothetical protein